MKFVLAFVPTTPLDAVFAAGALIAAVSKILAPLVHFTAAHV